MIQFRNMSIKRSQNEKISVFFNFKTTKISPIRDLDPISA